MDKLLERFLNYVSLGYPIKGRVTQVPHNGRPMEVIASAEREQLEEMGLCINVTLSEKGTLMATLPANVPAISRRLALFLVDTSPIAAAKM